MAPALITDVIQHLADTIAKTSAEALTCTDLDGDFKHRHKWFD